MKRQNKRNVLARLLPVARKAEPRRRCHSLPAIALGVVLGLLGWVNPAISQTYHTHQITNNEANCVGLQINDCGQIVWQRSDGDNEIYLYSNNNITKITDNSLDDRNPQINDSGQIVWEGYDGTDYQIFTYNNGPTTQLTTDVSPDPGVFWAHSSPQINAGGHIVWMGVDQWTENYYTVTGYQLFLDGLQITFHPDPAPPEVGHEAGYYPRINDSGQIVFEDGAGEIALWENGIYKQLTNTAYTENDPRINALGEIVWEAIVSGTSNVYYYDSRVGGETPHLIGQGSNPQISDNGQIVWQGYDGHDYEIYLYSNNTATPITNNSYDDSSPQINASGQIVWSGGQNIYTYVNGATIQVTNNDLTLEYDGLPQINDNGQIAFRRGGATNYDVFLAEPDTTSNAYSYKFTYGNSDYYLGTVYAPEGYGYHVGYYSPTITDENGNAGSYYISAVQTGFDLSKSGEVYVTSYYDKESGKTYTPVSNGSAVGSNYLGSEVDYIIKKDIPEFEFGKGTGGTFYEADIGSYSRYDFNFYYNNGSGDYYTGYVYAPMSFQTIDLQLAVGKKLYDQPMEFWASYKSFNGGYYDITAITDGFASTYDKKSYITAYYDADTAQASLGVNSDGSATAGSIYVPNRTVAWETGYAISGSNHATFNPYTEADVTLTVSSTFSVSEAVPAAPPSASAAPNLALWSTYWSQIPGLLEEDLNK